MSAHTFSIRPVGSGCSRPPNYRWMCSCDVWSVPYLTAEQAEAAGARHVAEESNS